MQHQQDTNLPWGEYTLLGDTVNYISESPHRPNVNL